MLPPRVMPAQPAPGLVHVGTYRRQVALTLARVYENALDWEHLPWLHAQDFSAIALHEAGEWGWRARVARQPASAGAFDLELLLDRARGLWVSRTIGTFAETGEIWTTAQPGPGAECTDLAIAFHVPAAQARDPERAFDRRRSLYARLWDQDEAFSWTREKRLAQRRRLQADRAGEPRELQLGTGAELRTRLPLTVEFAGERWRIVADGDVLRVHAANCPHMLGPLDEGPVVDGCVRCPWHGYRFDVVSGAGRDGVTLRLPEPPVLEHGADGWTLRQGGTGRPGR